MSSVENKQQAQEGYAAFGRGDLAAVLEILTDDVEWVVPGPPEIIPEAGTHRGKDAVGAWFGSLAENIDITTFEPREFIADGDKVACVLYIESTVRSTGNKVAQDEVHLWTFRDGKVARFQVFQDTAAVVAGFGA